MNPMLLLFFICFSIQSFAQTPYKRSAVTLSTSAEDTIKVLSLETFLPMLLNIGGCVGKKEQAYYGYNEIYRDTAYTYFSRITLKGDSRFKVLIKDLNKIKYDSCMAYNINKEFFDTFVDKKDRSRKPDPVICPVTPSSANYKYRYIDSLNAVEIQLHWRIYCEILIKLVNKRYKGIYYFDTGELKKLN